MKLPETFFSRYFKDKTCLLIDNVIHDISLDGDDLRLYSHKFKVEKKEPIEKLEKAYLERYADLFCEKNQDMGSEAKDFIEFANIICNKSKNEGGENSIINSLLEEDYFIHGGNFFPMIKVISGDVSFNEKSYSIINYTNLSLDEIETRYLGLLKAKIRKGQYKEDLLSMVNSGYYDKVREVGFKIINDAFHVLTIIKPYTLFERKNNKYYKFNAACIGSVLYKNNNKACFSPLKVINRYSHPCLEKFDEPMQKVCVGHFDYNSIRKIHSASIENQILNLMRKGRNVLRKEYRSKGNPHHRLTSPYFQYMGTNCPKMEEVTNI